MDTIPRPSWLRRHPVAITIMHGLLIIVYLGVFDTLIGDSFLYLDRLFLYGTLFSLQWLLLGQPRGMQGWVVVGSVTALLLMMFNEVVTKRLIVSPLRDRFFPFMPNSVMAKEYYLMEFVIFNTVLGLGLGIFQAGMLKHISRHYRWWIPMTTLAYTATSFWSSYHFIVK